MKSTGEVMGIDRDPGMALAKALVSTGAGLPTSGTVFVSVANRDKRAIVFPAKRLADLGFRLVATSGTAGVLERAGIVVERVAKVSEGPHNVADLIRGGKVDLVINTPFGRGPRSDGYFIRTATASAGVPCITTLPGVFAAVRGIEAFAGRAERTAVAPGASRDRRAVVPRRSRLTFAEATASVTGESAMKRVRAEILSTRKLGAYHSITLVAPEIAERARPGQFLAIQMPEGREFLLRRHFAVHQASRRGGWAGTLEFVVDPSGAGNASGWGTRERTSSWT